MEEPYYIFKFKQKRQHNDGLLSIYEKVHHMMDRVCHMMDGVLHMMDTFFRQICYISELHHMMATHIHHMMDPKSSK